MGLVTFERDAPIDEIVTVLHRDGAVTIRECIEPGKMDQLIGICDGLLANEEIGGGEFWGNRRRGGFGLFARGPEFAELLTNPVVHAIADAMLLPNCNAYQVHASGFGQIFGGGIAQPLHRATDIYEPYLPYVPDGPERIISFMWAGTDFTEENGATHVAPGSNHWPADREATMEETVQAVMPKGSFTIWLSGTIHGMAASQSATARSHIFISMSAGWLRSEENQYLTVPTEMVEQLPLRAQQLLGYRTFGSALGFVEGRDPQCLLNPGEDGLSDPLADADRVAAEKKAGGTS